MLHRPTGTVGQLGAGAATNRMSVVLPALLGDEGDAENTGTNPIKAGLFKTDALCRGGLSGEKREDP